MKLHYTAAVQPLKNRSVLFVLAVKLTFLFTDKIEKRPYHSEKNTIDQPTPKYKD